MPWRYFFTCPRLNKGVSHALFLGVYLGFLGFYQGAQAEYRAYELEVADITECRLTKRNPCPSNIVISGLSPNTYANTHGGDRHVVALLLATWMCYGDTSNYTPVCPRPPPKKPRFKAGDAVQVALKKHVSGGWQGKVERAYYQRSVRSNVYGIRFARYQNLYARYYEKDLVKIKSP